MKAQWCSMNSLALFIGLWVGAPPAQAFYDPSLARWINRDPIGESGFELVRASHAWKAHPEFRHAVFVQNGPVNLTDPEGLTSGWECLGMVCKALWKSSVCIASVPVGTLGCGEICSTAGPWACVACVVVAVDFTVESCTSAYEAWQTFHKHVQNGDCPVYVPEGYPPISM